MDSDNTRTIPFPPFIPGAGRGEAGEGEPAPGWKSGGGGEGGERQEEEEEEGRGGKKEGTPPARKTDRDRSSAALRAL